MAGMAAETLDLVRALDRDAVALATIRTVELNAPLSLLPSIYFGGRAR